MEYKILPPRKRKLDRFILEEIDTISESREQGNTHYDSLPEIKSCAPISAHRVHHSQSPQQLKIHSGEACVELNVTSLVIDDVGEQGRYSTIERRDSEFDEDPHPESSQKNRMGSEGNNSYYPETALVKTSQQGFQDTGVACGGMMKLLKASAACSTDTDIFCNDHRVLMKGAGEDVDGFNCPSMASDEAAPVASEKIWEGSMQFNTNTTVPILAFFKSGQKLFDINWSALVVIKGKTPLEDFEKYIKDLPRSRTRKLMVISLCWKLGSSRTGLKRLIEVVKRYKMNKRVAYAQPSPDVRLYLYPWNEVITTLLVKCGYLGENEAVADRSELLLGCVVWRTGTCPLKEQDQLDSSDLVSDSQTLSSSKFICARYDKKNLSVGNGNDLSGLISSMLEPSAVEKKEPSHSDSFTTSSRNLPVDSPGHLTPSKFPVSLDSSHEPRRFSGSPLLWKVLPPVPNLQNSLSRHFTFLHNPRQPSSVPDVNHPSAN